MVQDEQGGGKQADWKGRFWTVLTYVPMVAVAVLIVVYWSLN